MNLSLRNKTVVNTDLLYRQHDSTQMCLTGMWGSVSSRFFKFTQTLIKPSEIMCIICIFKLSIGGFYQQANLIHSCNYLIDIQKRMTNNPHSRRYMIITSRCHKCVPYCWQFCFTTELILGLSVSVQRDRSILQ